METELIGGEFGIVELLPSEPRNQPWFPKAATLVNESPTQINIQSPFENVVDKVTVFAASEKVTPLDRLVISMKCAILGIGLVYRHGTDLGLGRPSDSTRRLPLAFKDNIMKVFDFNNLYGPN